MADWLDSDATLLCTLARELGDDDASRWLGPLRFWAEALAGRGAALGEARDRHPPHLVTHDRFGERVDRVGGHPAHDEAARLCFEDLGLLWARHEGLGGVPLPPPLCFAGAYLLAQADASQCAALALSDAAARVVARHGDEALRRDLLPRLFARSPAARATGALLFTERGAGSDLRMIQTVAVRDGTGYRLSGEKWHAAAVDAGVLLVLARAADDGGLRLFAALAELPDGRRNGLTIQRLLPTMGLRGLPLGQVTLDGTFARPVGDDGMRAVLEALNLGRLYSALASMGILRRALREALAVLGERQVFRRRALDQPLVIEAVAALAAEAAGGLHLCFDLAGRLALCDSGAATATDRRVLRLLTPLCKGYLAHKGVCGARAALELQGGNGYLEDFAAPRLLRDAQGLALFAGTNDLCLLDGLRALSRPGVADALLREAERKLVAITHPRLRQLAEQTRRHLDRVERSLQRLFGFGQEVLQHHARPVLDALLQSYQVALALSESDRLDEHGQGGRDYLVAERLLHQNLDRPSLETVGPWHVDPLRLQVLLGQRIARVAEVA